MIAMEFGDIILGAVTAATAQAARHQISIVSSPTVYPLAPILKEPKNGSVIRGLMFTLPVMIIFWSIIIYIF